MKKKGLVLGIGALLFLFNLGFAQDPGVLDTVSFYPNYLFYPSTGGTAKVYLHIYVSNDESLMVITAPFKWTGAVIFDSVSFKDSRVFYLENKTVNPNLDSNTVLIGAVPVKEQLIPSGRGLFATLCFTLTDSATVTLDSTFFLPINTLRFVTTQPEGFVPVFQPTTFTPLLYLPGDIGFDEIVDIEDIVFLINYVFYSGEAPQYKVTGDVNGDCLIDISDIVLLINCIFYGGESPKPGCPW
jgi:hypothetical protein